MMFRARGARVSRMVSTLLFLVLVLGAFGLVRLRSSIVCLEYGIGALEKKKSEALMEEKALSAELASLHSIGEVEERKIAMVFPDRKNVVYIKRDAGGVPFVASFKK